MPEPKREQPKVEQQDSQEVRPILEASPAERVAETPSEITPAEKERQIEELRAEVEKITDSTPPAETKTEDKEVKQAKIKQYQERHLPEYIKDRGRIAKMLTNFWVGPEDFKKEGAENIPEKGPFIVVSNHFGGNDAEAIIKTFKNTDLHFAVAKEMWWNSSPIQKWILQKFGMIPVEESLSNLTEQEKEEALQRQGGNGKKVFRKIIDREKQGKVATNIEFIHQAVATLLRGDALGVFPEGLWLNPGGMGKSAREKKELKQGYRGIELIASQYQKLTGEELPIIPTAFIRDESTGEKKVIVGQPLKLSENESENNGTDWCMKHVAEMLPEEQRGYYKDKE